MNIQIGVGENFCCLVFTQLIPVFSDTLQLRPNLWASRGLPVIPGEHWERWVGELAFRDIKTAFVITETARQPRAGHVVNAELKTRLDLLLTALAIQGVANYRECYLISGANETGTADARQFSRGRILYTTAGIGSLRVGPDELEAAILYREKLVSINYPGEDWRRLRRSIDVLVKGSREPVLQDDRLHQFARCIEGLILPATWNTKNHFVHRAQTFAVASPATKLALGQIFDIRSKVEHLHNPISILPGASKEKREELLFRRARQIDCLARFAIRRVLENQTLTNLFSSEDGIAKFWHKSDDERLATWGKRLDLQKIS